MDNIINVTIVNGEAVDGNGNRLIIQHNDVYHKLVPDDEGQRDKLKAVVEIINE